MADIRRSLREGARPTVLARQYGVDYTLIWQIGKRMIWKHVQEEDDQTYNVAD